MRQEKHFSGHVNWLAVITFYVVACAISWPLFWIRDQHREIWESWHFPIYFNKGWLPALGPLVAGFVACWIFRKTHHRRVTAFGSSFLFSSSLVAVAVVVLTAVGVGSDEPHLTGLFFAAVYIVYGFLEESGWRGFLQDALRPLPDQRRYVTIGLMWGAWHFTSFASGTPFEAARRLALMTILWIAGSWGIGVAVERTRSLSVAGMLHLVFNLSRALPAGKSILVLSVCGLTWWALLRRWPQPVEPPSG